ncbi:MAG: FecR domain-containing protein [Pseudomonadota bacterium]
MTRKVCARLWQVEAARDGRLAGRDLSNALRHRVECADCSQEARALSELRRQIKAIPIQPLDPLLRRRTRQTLLGAWNEQLLGEREPKARRRLALIAACCVAATAALAIGYPLARRSARRSEPSAPFFEVAARPGTVWTARAASNVTRITLQDGFASFTVRRPSGLRMFVDLPDGEIEDLGTVFQVEVQQQRTVHVSVSRGRVFVRLQARPGFELKAGQSWQAEPSSLPAAALPAISAQPLITNPPASSASAKGQVARIPHERVAAHARAAAPAPARSPADTAEDDAYLHIIDLLRNGHELEARSQATQYLARFPNGFRHREVQNIAQGPGASAP